MIDQELLWKAWPDGFLAARGVSTVGDWMCVQPLPADHRVAPNTPLWLHPNKVCLYGRRDDGFYVGYGPGASINQTPFTEAIAAGALLPNVDPTDTAAWACLLADLAMAAGVSHTAEGVRFSYTNDLDTPRRILGERWVLSSANYGRVKTFRLRSKDKAEALVLARIQLREAEDGD